MILIITLVVILILLSVYYYVKFIKNRNKCKNPDYTVITHKEQIEGFPNLSMGDVCWRSEDDVKDYCINDNVDPFVKAAHEKKYGIDFSNVKFCNEEVEDRFSNAYMKF